MIYTAGFEANPRRDSQHPASKKVLLFNENGLVIRRFKSINEVQNVLKISYSEASGGASTGIETKNGYKLKFA